MRQLYSWLHRISSKPQERGEYSSGPWPDLIRVEALRLCQGIHGKILEVGCGEGLFLIPCAQQNPYAEIYGVDNNRERLASAGKKARNANLTTIRLSEQEAPHLAFEDGFFDAVVCINVFFNMPSQELVGQTLLQLKRVCKAGGKIIFEFRNSQNPFLKLKYATARYYDATLNNVPLRTYNPKEIRGFLQQAHLSVTKLIRLGFPVKTFAPIILVEAENS